MKVSTGFRNHLLVTGSAKSALDGKVIRMYGSPTSVAAAEALVPATADAGIGTATLLATISVGGAGTGITFDTTATSGVLAKAPAEEWKGAMGASGYFSFCRIMATDDTGAENALDIDAVVIIKTLVFNGDKSVLQILRDHVQRNGNTVRIGGHEFGGLVSVLVKNEGGIAGRRHIDVADVGSGVDNGAECTDPDAGCENGCRDEKQKNDLHQSDGDLPVAFFRFRCEMPHQAVDVRLSVIHAAAGPVPFRF